MRSRGLVVALALLLAILATAGVFLYVRAVKNDAETGGNLVTVVVSTQSISANTPLNGLLDEGGVFELQQIPSDAVVENAVTNPEQLRNRTAVSAILAGEQIPLSRLSGSEATLPGGKLGLEPGYQGVTVRLDAEQFVGQNIAVGDRVSVYALFPNLQVIPLPAERIVNAPQNSQGAKTGKRDVGDLAVMLVPEARVLAVSGTSSVTTTTSEAAADHGGANAQADAQEVVTLELLPEDVQKLVLAQNEGVVWLAVIRPGDDAPALPPFDFSTLFGKSVEAAP